jgi:hypothetical protein
MLRQILPDMWKNNGFYEGFQFWPFCAGKEDVKAKTDMEHSIIHADRGEKEHSEKSLPSATVFTAHLTWTGPRLKSHSIIHFSFYVAENTIFMHYK